jgi:hypothetical protein
VRRRQRDAQLTSALAMERPNRTGSLFATPMLLLLARTDTALRAIAALRGENGLAMRESLALDGRSVDTGTYCR